MNIVQLAGLPFNDNIFQESSFLVMQALRSCAAIAAQLVVLPEAAPVQHLHPRAQSGKGDSEAEFRCYATIATSEMLISSFHWKRNRANAASRIPAGPAKARHVAPPHRYSVGLGACIRSCTVCEKRAHAVKRQVYRMKLFLIGTSAAFNQPQHSLPQAFGFTPPTMHSAKSATRRL